MDKLICYCFNYSEADIEQDVRDNGGKSTILERIKASKQAGQCRCPEKNPTGKWCLADVHRVVDTTSERLKQPSP